MVTPNITNNKKKEISINCLKYIERSIYNSNYYDNKPINCLHNYLRCEIISHSKVATQT